jgi:hypothetical protein
MAGESTTNSLPFLHKRFCITSAFRRRKPHVRSHLADLLLFGISVSSP